MKRILLFTITFVALFFFVPSISAASYTIYRANSVCNVRIGPGTNYSIIKNGSDNVQVQTNQDLDYINEKNGTVNGTNGTWYGVKFDYATRQYTGYVWSNCVDVNTYSYSDDTTFEDSIKSFPESFKPYLRKLHAEHNNWTFTANYANLDWNSVVEAESQKGESAVSSAYPSLFFRDSVNPNGIVVDGYSWYAPCSDAVAYFLDARNFLMPKYLFMFEKLSYDESQNETVQSVLNGTFMEGTFTENGITKSYKDAFIEAGRAANINPIHLASRVVQEIGSKRTSAVSGTVAGYEGYYNFYNIGAYSGADNYLKGLQYAKDQGWNGIQKAITGGASFLSSKYIGKGQDTIYYEKFNTASYRKYNAYTHQYMTNIMAPRSEAVTTFNSYKNAGKLSSKYVFVIPVYDYMPATAFKLSTTDTVGGSTQPTTTIQKQENPSVQEPDTKVKNVGYRVNGNYISGFALGTNISTIKDRLNASANKSSGSLATGDRLTVDGKTYEVVVYGDVSGDAAITIKDLLFVQRNILGSKSLSGVYKTAADVSKDGKVTIKDLLLVQKHILGYSKIDQ